MRKVPSCMAVFATGASSSYHSTLSFPEFVHASLVRIVDWSGPLTPTADAI